MVKKMGKVKARFRKKEELRKYNKNKAYIKGLINSIRKFDDPILTQKCEEITEMDWFENLPRYEKEKIDKMVKDIKKVFAVTKNGVGLAAPQVGLTKRIIVYRTLEERSRIFVLINPNIIDKSDKTEEGIEQCLSYPGYESKVSRYTSIEVEYFDENYRKIKSKFEGFTARVIQHEMDHLDGICLVGEEYKKKKEI